MTGSAGGVAHVVQAVEHRDQVVTMAREGSRGRYFEAHPLRDTSSSSAFSRRFDGTFVVIRPKEHGRAEGLGHEHCGSAMATAHVSHLRSPFQLIYDAVTGRQPFVDKVGVVTRTEETLATIVNVLTLLMPATPGTCLSGFKDPRRAEQ